MTTDLYTHRIEVYTAGLVIGGAYDLTLYRRVSDALNDDQRRYLPLRAASVAAITQPQQTQQVPRMLVDRTRAILVATIEEAVPPQEYPRSEQVRGVVPVAALIFTSAFVVRATVHKRPDRDLVEWLDQVSDTFLPLSAVSVLPLGQNFAPLTRDFAAIARDQVIAICEASE